MASKKMLDVYECYWYRHYGEKCSYWCKDYPNFCNKCAEPIKVGTIKTSEVNNDNTSKMV